MMTLYKLDRAGSGHLEVEFPLTTTTEAAMFTTLVLCALVGMCLADGGYQFHGHYGSKSLWIIRLTLGVISAMQRQTGVTA